MNWNRIEGNLKQMKGAILQKWDKAAGERDKLVGVLQERYGYSREGAEARVDRLARQFPDEPRH